MFGLTSVAVLTPLMVPDCGQACVPAGPFFPIRAQEHAHPAVDGRLADVDVRLQDRLQEMASVIEYSMDVSSLLIRARNSAVARRGDNRHFLVAQEAIL